MIKSLTVSQKFQSQLIRDRVINYEKVDSSLSTWIYLFNISAPLVWFYTLASLSLCHEPVIFPIDRLWLELRLCIVKQELANGVFIHKRIPRLSCPLSCIRIAVVVWISFWSSNSSPSSCSSRFRRWSAIRPATAPTLVKSSSFLLFFVFLTSRLGWVGSLFALAWTRI